MLKIAIAALLSTVCSAAMAQDFNRTIRVFTGRSTVLNAHTTISPRCFTKPADVFVVAPPGAGRISLSRGSRFVRASFGAPAARCNGAQGQATVVTYTSKRGFVGTDHLTYRVQYAKENGDNLKDFAYTIEVVGLPNDMRDRGWYPPR